MSSIVTPYQVIQVDYNKLVTEFGTTLIDQETITTLQSLTALPLHPLLKRGTYFSHRSLNEIIQTIQEKQPFYVYTGRGPSAESMHIGHLLQFEFTKWLQDAFGVQVVIQLTDDEKFFWKNFTLEQVSQLALDNAKDIIACGFDPSKTFIFRDTDYIHSLYPNIVKIQKCLTANQIRHALGLSDTDNIGKYAYTAIQSAPSFSTSFPHLFQTPTRCLIPCGIDQDAFFRMTRDVAPRIGYFKPAVIHSKFLPGLQGIGSKMSSSDPATCILLSDTPTEIKNKINKKAFSGGKDNIDDHRKYGGDCTVDIAYQYLTFFLEDEVHLEDIRKKYSTGEMLSGDLKKILIDILVTKITEHQARRKTITPEVLALFMKK